MTESSCSAVAARTGVLGLGTEGASAGYEGRKVSERDRLAGVRDVPLHADRHRAIVAVASSPRPQGVEPTSCSANLTVVPSVMLIANVTTPTHCPPDERIQRCKAPGGPAGAMPV